MTEELKQKANINDDSPNVRFVINTIAYVPDNKTSFEYDSEDDPNLSDSDTYDPDFKDKYSSLDLGDINTFPYRTVKKKKERKAHEVKDVIFTKSKKLHIEPIEKSASLKQSGMLQPFFSKLEQEGFSKADEKCLGYIAASIGLNRPKSLSDRKNGLLHEELNSSLSTNVNHKIYGFFWFRQWYDKQGKKVLQEDFGKIKTFYKKLKHKNSEAADTFRYINEQSDLVPYQHLREYVAKHDKTKDLIKNFRELNPDIPIYYSFIDLDTIDFNGIYSAYLRIVTKPNFPTIMSTGYQFSSKGTDVPYGLASYIDRLIRVKTAEIIPMGVYYPEPNFCVLLPNSDDLLPETFIDNKMQKNKSFKSESPVLLRQIQNRKNTTFVFIDDNYIVTAIRDSARYTKSTRSGEQPQKIDFSQDLLEEKTPDPKDFKLFYDEVSQSHYNTWIWANSLYINRPFELTSISERDNFIKIMCDIRKLVADDQQRDKLTQLESELKKIVEPVDFVKKLINVCREVNKKIKTTIENDEYLNTRLLYVKNVLTQLGITKELQNNIATDQVFIIGELIIALNLDSSNCTQELKDSFKKSLVEYVDDKYSDNIEALVDSDIIDLLKTGEIDISYICKLIDIFWHECDDKMSYWRAASYGGIGEFFDFVASLKPKEREALAKEFDKNPVFSFVTDFKDYQCIIASEKFANYLDDVSFLEDRDKDLEDLLPILQHLQLFNSYDKQEFENFLQKHNDDWIIYLLSSHLLDLVGHENCISFKQLSQAIVDYELERYDLDKSIFYNFMEDRNVFDVEKFNSLVDALTGSTESSYEEDLSP